MRIIPAIDLLGGACVRLSQGDFARTAVCDADPDAVAERFAKAGARLIHLVDLDGARQGRPVQAETILRIARHAPVEAGGGLRNMAGIAAYLENGVARVVLGSAAVKNPELVREAVARYGGRVILSLDVRHGRAAVEGWTETSGMDAGELAAAIAGLGIEEIIYTDISRDGMLTGPNLAGLIHLIRETGLRVIASGGISTLADLKALAAAGADGAIIGKALYAGQIDLKQAIMEFEDS